MIDIDMECNNNLVRMTSKGFYFSYELFVVQNLLDVYLFYFKYEIVAYHKSRRLGEQWIIEK